jgi:PAS domain S-box-containing protein
VTRSTSESRTPLRLEGDEPFRRMVQSVRDYAIFLLDAGGHIASWNIGAERIKGYAAAEILGRHFSVFYPAEAVARGWPDYELATARRLGAFEDEGWRLRKSGEPFWANVVITKLTDEEGEFIGFSKITRDLTERRAHEETLRQSEERFRLLVEGVQDYAIFLLDPEGRVASWNSGARLINGYESHEILGQHFSRFYPQEAIDRGWPEHELEVARAVGRFEDEGWRIRKDGSRVWTNVVITTLYDAKGAIRGFAKVTRDLTQRRRVELLEQEGRRINEFLAMLGHELRNPLAVIHHSVALVRAKGGPDPSLVRASEVMDRQVRHLVRIVDDLLDVGRITTGKIAMVHQPLDFSAVVAESVANARPGCEAKGQILIAEIPATPLRISGDPTRMTQVVVNLLNNATKYTPDGGRIEVSLTSDGTRVQLVVKDDGMGIAPDLLPDVFDLFVQGAQSTDRSNGGLGVGLTLVRKLIELHGGSVSATSPGLGQGSTFVVHLPLLREV